MRVGAHFRPARSLANRPEEFQQGFQIWWAWKDNQFLLVGLQSALGASDHFRVASARNGAARIALRNAGSGLSDSTCSCTLVKPRGGVLVIAVASSNDPAVTSSRCASPISPRPV